MNARRTISTLMIAASLAGFTATQTGCPAVAAAMPVISDVALVIQEAQSILEMIDGAFNTFANQNNLPPATVQQFQTLSSTCFDALAAGIATIQGIQNLQQSDVDSAFAKFRAAYADLNAFLFNVGIKTPNLTAKQATVPLRDPILVRGYKMKTYKGP